MPLEVRELVIKATVDNGNSGSENSGLASDSGSADTVQTEDLVNLVVEKVLEIIKEKSER